MGSCEDFPCCGHELGCCPRTNDGVYHMVCTCGATLPADARFSICDGCMRRAAREDGDAWDDWDGEREYDD